jgi:ABC-type glycerol-3-phosphate transport system permease component
VLPLAAPGLVTAGLLTAFFVWNEFLPLVALVIIFQKRIVAGLTAGAVKG